MSTDIRWLDDVHNVSSKEKGHACPACIIYKNEINKTRFEMCAYAKCYVIKKLGIVHMTCSLQFL